MTPSIPIRSTKRVPGDEIKERVASGEDLGQFCAAAARQSWLRERPFVASVRFPDERAFVEGDQPGAAARQAATIYHEGMAAGGISNLDPMFDRSRLKRVVHVANRDARAKFEGKKTELQERGLSAKERFMFLGVPARSLHLALQGELGRIEWGFGPGVVPVSANLPSAQRCGPVLVLCRVLLGHDQTDGTRTHRWEDLSRLGAHPGMEDRRDLYLVKESGAVLPHCVYHFAVRKGWKGKRRREWGDVLDDPRPHPEDVEAGGGGGGVVQEGGWACSVM